MRPNRPIFIAYPIDQGLDERGAIPPQQFTRVLTWAIRKDMGGSEGFAANNVLGGNWKTSFKIWDRKPRPNTECYVIDEDARYDIEVVQEANSDARARMLELICVRHLPKRVE